MKILQVIHYFSPLHGGGSINVVYYLSKQLTKRGHEVTIFSSDFELDKEYIHSLDGVRVVLFHYIANIGSMLITPKMTGLLDKEIRNFDVIHMQNFRTYQNIIVHKFAKKHNIPYILQAHGSLSRIMGKKGLKYLFDVFFGYKILRDASIVIASTKIEAEQYKNMGVDENKIEIIPNGFDQSEYENLPDKEVFREKYGIKRNEKIVLYLGRLHKIKGIDLLVEAFSNLIYKMDDVKLVIAGPDDGFLSILKTQIEDLKIGNKIVFTGPLSEKDKLGAYVDADVYVLPSVYENFGITVLEACACSTPIIVTNRCGIADMVEKVGLVVEYNKDQLQDAMFKMLSDDGLRRRCGEKGKQLVMKELVWDKVVAKIEVIYEICTKR